MKHKSITSLLFCLLITFSVITAQSQFPLEVGNEWCIADYSWDYGSSARLDTFSVKIETDTTLSNNKTYFRFNNNAFFGYRFYRSDSTALYAFDEQQLDEKLLIRFNMDIGESIEILTDMISYVDLEYIDSISVFGTQSKNYTYRLDGLMVHYITLSDKFGPVRMGSPGEPPGTADMHSTTIGCIISGESYGLILSIREKHSDFENYLLYQNYPNPFNPTTKISYSLSQPGRVSIIIYDVLGKEVSKLVDEYKTGGNYSRNFNASNLQSGYSSGVYFYQMRANGSVHTKKMILLR